ncbi:MAG TPA: aminotransferase class I/II-fold pyridoxal phosphate-dependent enzyme [bacterium]|nr:aminotransferase class I/II-fold pyridoxal phosphate-dependent enzyme [bacterium]
MAQTFQPFEMERMMSKWENAVEYNLSESGVHPMIIRELIDDADDIDALLDTEINYPQANGLPALRERIAALYEESRPEQVLVTVGCIEANYLALHTLLEPGDEMAMMLPNYMQLWGVARNRGIQIRPFYLREENDWALDMGDAVTEKTRLIAVCNPNNPTGYILTEDEMDEIVRQAERVGAWILADEVYAGTERLTDRETPSFRGRYDRVLANGSLSKAYGIPGLRIGWTVGPENTVDDMWARREYITISAGMLSNKLAEIALRPQVRRRILRRTRDYIRRGYPVLEEWMNSQGGLFDVVPPQAAAIAFVRYHLNVNSTEFVNRLIREKSVLIVPGDQFGMDRHFRISYGLSPERLEPALERIEELLNEYTAS